MNKNFTRWITDVWYEDHFIGAALMPLGFLFSDVVKFRKFLYRIGVLKRHKLSVPVIIVGNITVGGTGKTPLTIWLTKLLQEAGYNPGIISRGYGGKAETWPQRVTIESDPSDIGDEALLMAKQTGCPIAVGPIRVDAAKLLITEAACDIIISDDGLQHYALNRDIEIAVVDGERRFGNGYCLPAGPLREPIDRLRTVDFVIVNGEAYEENELTMHLVGDELVNCQTGDIKTLQDFKGIECHALAGIGNPKRFYKVLESASIPCKVHSFPDHHQYQANEIVFGDDRPVLMTEKDAVKCTGFASAQHWYLPVKAVPEPLFSEQFLNLLKRKAC